MDSKEFKKKNYNFHYSILTDGLGCSILFDNMTSEELKKFNKKSSTINFSNKKNKDKNKEILYIEDLENVKRFFNGKRNM